MRFENPVYQPPQALIFNPQEGCNSRCLTCGNTYPPDYWKSLQKQPLEVLTLEQAKSVIDYFMMMGFLGKDGIRDIRWAGIFSESALWKPMPTLIPDLVQKLPPGVVTTPFTNMTGIPSGEYNDTAMREYFEKTWGLAKWPPNFNLIISVDKSHLWGLWMASLKDTRLPFVEFKANYLNQIKNITQFARENQALARLTVNTVVPPGREDQKEAVRSEFNIPSDVKIDTLTLSAYTADMDQQFGPNIPRLAGTDRPGIDDPAPKIVFIGAWGRDGPLVFEGLSGMGYRQNGLPFRDWAHQTQWGEHRTALVDFMSSGTPGDAFTIKNIRGTAVDEIIVINSKKPCEHTPGKSSGRNLPHYDIVFGSLVQNSRLPIRSPYRTTVESDRIYCPYLDCGVAYPKRRLSWIVRNGESQPPARIDHQKKRLVVGDDRLDFPDLEQGLVPFPELLTMI